MKETVWLHVGTHKTGTTAIQNSLQHYDDGVTRYAHLSRPNHSLALSALFRESGAARKSMENQGITGEAAQKWIDSARENLLKELSGPARHLILSAEVMTMLSAADFARLRDFIAPHARSIRVLAYVRDPLGYASSMFQQSVKNGRSTFVLPDLAYRPQLEPALSVFGKAAMEVVLFGAKSLPGGDVITDFCQRTGTDRSRVRPEPANERLSAAAIGVIYDFNRRPESKLGTQARFRARYALIERLGLALPGKLRLAPDLVRKAASPDDLAWLAETWGIDFRAGLAGARREPDDVGSESDLFAAKEAARPALERLAAWRLIRSRGRSTEELFLRLYKSEIARQSLIGLVRPRR